MYERILIPTDGSQTSLAAARHGAAVAQAFDAEVTILSVVDTRQFSDQLAELDQLVREQRGALERRAREAVDETSQLIHDLDVASSSVVQDGIPHDEICRYAQEDAVDLIAMGTHGRSGLDRFLMGSVAERVIRTSETPVLAVPPSATDRRGFIDGPILLPTDGSPAADAAIPHAMALAERFAVPLHVLNVIRTDRGLPDLGDPASEAAWETVGAVAEQAAGRNIEVETHVQSGSPHEQLRRFAQSHGIDLVAMGTHGRSGLSRHLIGSVTERTLRTSDIPVLTVRGEGG